MKEFLRKIKLVENLTTEITIQKNEFVSNFKDHVDEASIGLFSDTFDAFSSSKKVYKGHVGYDNFKIKKRRKFFDMNTNLAIAEGTFRQKDQTLIIKTEITGFNGIMLPFYIFGIIFYIIFIGMFFSFNTMEGEAPGFILPFLIIHAAFMFGIPYFMMRRSTTKMAHELEREFYYMTKDLSSYNTM